MKSRIKIWSYNTGSHSARVLSNQLTERLRRNVPILKSETTSAYRSRSTDILVNFGNSQDNGRFAQTPHFLNQPISVRDWSNKRVGYEALQTRAPEFAVPFTTNRAEAERWLTDGNQVVCRHKLTGHSGEGIEIVSENLPSAPVYTKYLKKSAEYRCHFFKQGDGFQFFWQQKKRNSSNPNPNWQVRNCDNGFIYATNDIRLPDDERKAAIEAAIVDACSDLDFGGVDIIYTNNRNGDLSHKYYILEVNTACGIQAPSLQEFYLSNFTRRLA